MTFVLYMKRHKVAEAKKDECIILHGFCASMQGRDTVKADKK